MGQSNHHHGDNCEDVKQQQAGMMMISDDDDLALAAQVSTVIYIRSKVVSLTPPTNVFADVGRRALTSSTRESTRRLLRGTHTKVSL